MSLGRSNYHMEGMSVVRKQLTLCGLSHHCSTSNVLQIFLTDISFTISDTNEDTHMQCLQERCCIFSEFWWIQERFAGEWHLGLFLYETTPK